MPLNCKTSEYWDNLKEKAIYNRQHQTQSEKLLWNLIRGKSLGVSFRRQHPIDQFIVDFVCLSIKLIIEVDGGYHDEEEQQIYDKNRSLILTDYGYTIIRFSNEEILSSPIDVINSIKHYINNLSN